MMEKSGSSSFMIKSLPSKENTYPSCGQEESGWTAYFEDFSNNNRSSLRDQKQKDDQEVEEEEEEENSFGCTSSMVSDAASCAAWNWKLSSHSNQHNNITPHACSNNFIGASPNNFLKKLSFKKTRTKKISGDDLEDTASSPVNSPKIGDLRTVGINPRRIDDHHMNFNSLGKEHFSEMEEADDDAEKATDCCVKNESTDLKKKGLCLVPMSLLVNYLV